MTRLSISLAARRRKRYSEGGCCATVRSRHASSFTERRAASIRRLPAAQTWMPRLSSDGPNRVRDPDQLKFYSPKATTVLNIQTRQHLNAEMPSTTASLHAN